MAVSPNQASQPSDAAFVQDAVASFKEMYGKVWDVNPTGKPFAQWTATDIKKLSKNGLSMIRIIAEYDHADVIGQVLPKSMTAAEFHHAALAEMARRGEASDLYGPSNSPATPTVFQFASFTNEGVTDIAKPVSIKPSDASVWNGSVAVLLHNAGSYDITPEVARAMGANMAGYGVTHVLSRVIPSDVAALDLGYAAGAVAAFDPKNSPNGPSIGVVFPPEISKQDIQQTYCGGVEAIYKTGRAIAQSDAFRTGFMQARIDAKKGFDLPDAHVGLFEPCPTPASGALIKEAMQKAG